MKTRTHPTVSTDIAADLLQVTPHRIRQLVREGDLRATKSKNVQQARWRIRRSDVRKLAKSKGL